MFYLCGRLNLFEDAEALPSRSKYSPNSLGDLCDSLDANDPYLDEKRKSVNEKVTEYYRNII